MTMLPSRFNVMWSRNVKQTLSCGSTAVAAALQFGETFALLGYTASSMAIRHEC